MELMKINYESDSPTVLLNWLNDCNDFQDFFTKMSSLRVEAKTIEELKMLRNAANMFDFKYSSDAIAYLKDSIDVEIALCRISKSRQFNEKTMQMQIIENFNSLFPEYTFVESEKVLEGIGRIDIYALYKGRSVIMELKTGTKSPNSQLISYSSRFEHPILIGITEREIPSKRRIDGIIYFTFAELLKSKGK